MRRILVLPLLAVAMAGAANGQGTAGNETDAVEQAKKEVLAVEAEQVQDVLKGDADALGRVYADDIAYTYASGEIVTKSQALANIRSGNNKLFVPNHDDLRLHVYGNTVVLTGRTQSTLRCCDAKAGPQKVQSRFTKVYIKQDGRWQMIVHQTTPIANP